MLAALKKLFSMLPDPVRKELVTANYIVNSAQSVEYFFKIVLGISSSFTSTFFTSVSFQEGRSDKKGSLYYTDKKEPPTTN